MRDIIIDVEVYHNLFIVGLYNMQAEQYCVLNETKLDLLEKIVYNDKTRLISFNGLHYDIPILRYAIDYKNNPNLLEELKSFSDYIICETNHVLVPIFKKYKYWDKDNIDLKNILGGRICPSLKKLAYRLRLKEIESLPVDPNKILTDEEKDIIIKYNKLDVMNTYELYKYCYPALELRLNLTKTFDVNCLSLSDAQIAEKILTANMYYPPTFTPSIEPMCELIAPYNFELPQLKNFYKKLLKCAVEFKQIYNPIKKKPSVQKYFIENNESKSQFILEDIIPNIEFRFGGAHSIHKTYIEGQNAYDIDVASYYPHLILKHNIAPEHNQEKFLNLYKDILNKRIKAKTLKDKTTADSLKIVLNSTFGHFNNWYSKLRSPTSLVKICLNGEMSVLRLIDLCYEHHIEVLMVNTDGIITKQNPEIVVKLWQDEMHMPLEINKIDKYFIKDSNNHILRYDDGSKKIKGVAFNYEQSMNKESNFPIINKAIVLNIIDNIPIDKTISECDNIYEFCGVYAKGYTIEKIKIAPTVKEDGVPAPNIIRFYLGTKSNNKIFRRNNKSWLRVADSDGIVIANKIEDKVFDDINKELYIEKAKLKLNKIKGVKVGKIK